MNKQTEKKTGYNATLLLTGNHNRGIEIKVPPLVGFGLLKYLEGVLSWTTTTENYVNVHKIYLEFAKDIYDPSDDSFYPTDFVYVINTYDSDIEATSQKRFKYDEELRFETLETWADKKIAQLCGDLWTPAKIKYMMDAYDMTPEALEEMYGEDLPDILDEFFDEDLWMIWSPGKIKWLKKHYGMTPEEAEALQGEDLSNLIDELFKLEEEYYDKPEGNIIASIADILQALESNDVEENMEETE